MPFFSKPDKPAEAEAENPLAGEATPADAPAKPVDEPGAATEILGVDGYPDSWPPPALNYCRSCREVVSWESAKVLGDPPYLYCPKCAAEQESSGGGGSVDSVDANASAGGGETTPS